MKKYFLIFIIALSMFLCSCGGNIKNVQINVTESSLYSSDEISDATDVVLNLKYFKENFDGCTMTRLEYDEQETLRQRKGGTAEYYVSDEIIVFVSDFDVDNSGGDGSFLPNSTERGWKWILARDDNEKWILENYGYA